MTQRPAVSVIVPFLGSEQELAEVRERLAALKLRADDELILSDNRLHPLHTPGFARNRGAQQARGEWLVFLDADTIPARDLLDAYFVPAPAESTAVLAGSVRDSAEPGGTWVARHSAARGHLDQNVTLRRAGTPYAQSVNCAIRRDAFDRMGGFAEKARAGEDADLCFRLYATGWRLEERPRAWAAHLGRSTLGKWLAQLLVHGSGAAWVEGRWPGEFPHAGARRLVARLARDAAHGLKALSRGSWEEARFALLDLVGALAFELGRLLPNTRHARTRGGRGVWPGARSGTSA